MQKKSSRSLLQLVQERVGIEQKTLATPFIQIPPLPLFTNGLPGGAEPGDDDVNFNPLTYAKHGTDSLAVHFRVNVQAVEGFNPATDTIYVRGSMIDDGWTVKEVGRLLPESNHDDLSNPKYPGANFYSRTILVPASKLGSELEYKFTIKNGGSVAWEDGLKGTSPTDVRAGGNRFFKLNGDTTLAWKYFDNKIPATGCTTCNSDVRLNFLVDLDKAITNNGYSLETDTMYVRIGLNATTDEVAFVKLENTGGTIFEGQADVKAEIGKEIQYAYFKVFKNNQDVRTEVKEFFFDNYDPVVGGNQENRKVTAAANVDVDDSATDNVSSHRSPYFRNTSLMAQNTKIILEVDYRPALNEVVKHGASLIDGQNSNFIVNASNINTYSVYVNGPITMNVDGTDWGVWTAAGLTDGRKMVDDGTGDDATANDSIWTITFDWLTSDDNAFVSQIFKFGIHGGDNEAGYGNNHIYNIKAGQAEQRVRASFGDIQPSRYPHWDYVNSRPTSVQQNGNGIPSDYALGKNYPNPFNPSTVIPFSVPKAGVVRIEIYNMVGQKVMEFEEVVSSAGDYSKTVDASHLTSGTYLYRMTSGSFKQTQKMLLVK